MTDNIKYGYGKYIWIIGVITLLGGGGLFAYLQDIGLEVVCEDKVCKVDEECLIECSVYNPTYQSKYLYNYDNWKITFTPEIEEFKLYAKYYGKWRFTNFTRETRFPNIKEERKYVFVFPRRTTKYFQIRVVLNSTTKIKFLFGTLDPIIQGYKYLYENLSKQVLIYEYTTILKEVKCYAENVSCTKSSYYNETTKTLIGTKTVYYDGKRIGVEVNEKEIIGYVNIDENILSKWDVPIRDRNFDEYGECLPHEIRKRVCKKIDLLK